MSERDTSNVQCKICESTWTMAACQSAPGKSELSDKLEDFDPDLSEWENMKANSWDRI